MPFVPPPSTLVSLAVGSGVHAFAVTLVAKGVTLDNTTHSSLASTDTGVCLSSHSEARHLVGIPSLVS